MTDAMVSVTIDGVPIQVAKGTMIIDAAKQAGVLIPHYCYHPSLPSPAVCRMCLVEVEKAPKLMPACVTAVADGQVVHVTSQVALDARKAVLEFLLINHPLDCPICDQAGECELQDFVYQEGRAGTRYSDYAKRYAPVEDFGPDVLYVPNRCILCTRCVRFMDSVAEDGVLEVCERGDRAFIGIDESERLDHPWSGNVVDLCPVGSLLSKDFLHKARAWDLDKTASICPGCTQGCNITVDTRDSSVVRLRPRPNLDVNRHFICDTGRADYRWMNRGDRVEAPLVRDGDRFQACDWNVALDRIASLVLEAEGGITVLAGGRASCESIGWLLRLAGERPRSAAMKVPLGDEAPIGSIPNLALRRERAANLEGGRLLGMGSDWGETMARLQGAPLVLVADVALDDGDIAALAGARRVVHFATVPDPRLANAEVVVPITTMVEEQGVYVNRDGRAQRLLPARSAPGMARPAWWAASQAWLRGGGGRQVPSTASEAFSTLTPFAGVTYRDLGFGGLTIGQRQEATT
ncbi:MAG TPA: 2Fe-2S iron-sulfur cluster-binding protein [Gemmatimonadales bacterium]|jgi:NADH-quinone oxidoreductase subunit G